MNAGIARQGRGLDLYRADLTFKDKLDTRIAGLDPQFLHVPSEAPDEIIVYLPDNCVDQR